MENDNPIMPSKVEKPYAGIIREWYNNTDIALYKITGVTQEVVDNWAKLVLETLETWPKNKPYLAIHDLSQPGVSLQYAALVNFDMMNIGITLEGRVLAERIFDAHEGFTARIAVNFNLSLSGQTNRTLMSFLNRDHPAIQYKTFYNRAKCLRWLTSGISDTSEMKAVNPNKTIAKPSTLATTPSTTPSAETPTTSTANAETPVDKPTTTPTSSKTDTD